MCNMMYHLDFVGARALLPPSSSKCKKEEQGEQGEQGKQGEQGVQGEQGKQRYSESEQGEQDEQGDTEADAGEDTFLDTCMCCYYWTSRREAQHVVPLPMQNLFWYVRTQARGLRRQQVRHANSAEARQDFHGDRKHLRSPKPCHD